MSIKAKNTGNGIYEFDYMRSPDTRTKWQIFKDAIYNPRERKVFDRTAKQWGKFLFYFILFFFFLIFTDTI